MIKIVILILVCCCCCSCVGGILKSIEDALIKKKAELSAKENKDKFMNKLAFIILRCFRYIFYIKHPLSCLEPSLSSQLCFLLFPLTFA